MNASMLTKVITSSCQRRMFVSTSKFIKKHIKNCLNRDRTFTSLSSVPIQPAHIPVMLEETVSSLNIKPRSIIIDMTFGAGGHTKEILSRFEDCKVISLDRDETAFQLANAMALESRGRILPLLGKFSELDKLLTEGGFKPGSIDGILIDHGCSSMQFDTPTRGFSLSKDGPLDMRMDGDRLADQITAADVVNHLTRDELMRIISKYGEERKAKEIAQSIVENRPFSRTKQLAAAIGNAVSLFDHSARQNSIGRRAHVATKTFMALRIFVNDEFNELHAALECAEKYLRHDGRLVALTFHSLEDRVIRKYFRKQMYSKIDEVDKNEERKKSRRNLHWKLEKNLTCSSTEEEVSFNPRSRSATMRVVTRCRNV